MSGTCLIKKGRSYSCSECEKKGLRPSFDCCPFCGERIVMRRDADKDCKLNEQRAEVKASEPEDAPGELCPCCLSTECNGECCDDLNG